MQGTPQDCNSLPETLVRPQSWNCTSFGPLPNRCLCTTSAWVQAMLPHCTKHMYPVRSCQQVKYCFQAPAWILPVPVRILHTTEFSPCRQQPWSKLQGRRTSIWREKKRKKKLWVFTLFYHAILIISTSLSGFNLQISSIYQSLPNWLNSDVGACLYHSIK